MIRLSSCFMCLLVDGNSQQLPSLPRVVQPKLSKHSLISIEHKQYKAFDIHPTHAQILSA